MAIAYPVLFLAGILLAYLVISLLAGRPLFTSGKRKKKEGAPPPEGREEAGIGTETEEEGAPRLCPLCGSLLLKKEFVKSAVFPVSSRAGNVSERMSNIFGCPFCYPANAQRPRLCPVCRKTIPEDGYLIARMFEKSRKGRKHIHV
ncbi:MAG: hypothetical protein LBC67_07575, partial [Spirochaetales bacterium]|nr:hypothetical protein [Spirochaetales bacterium]